MRTESTTDEDPSASLMPAPLTAGIAPQSPWRVTAVEALPGFRLRVAFTDGTSGIVDLSRLVCSPKAGVFAALADPPLFEQVRLDYGAVTWPGELDLAPDAMHAAIQQHGEWCM